MESCSDYTGIFSIYASSKKMGREGYIMKKRVGVAATMITANVLTLTSAQICKVKSKNFKACMYYITIAMLLLDPLYLSILCGFFGGGDMNGIALLLPEWLAGSFFGVLLVINCVMFWKVVLPKYKEAFAEQ